MPEAPKIKIAKSILYKRIAKLTARALLALGLLLLTVYGIFAATLLRGLPTSNGLVWVKDSTYRGDVIPPGKAWVASTEHSVSDTTGGHFLQAFSNQGPVVTLKILAGPTDQLSWITSQEVRIGGHTFSHVQGLKPSQKYLENQYLGLCMKGACKGGSLLVLPRNHGYGVPLGETKGGR